MSPYPDWQPQLDVSGWKTCTQHAADVCWPWLMWVCELHHVGCFEPNVCSLLYIQDYIFFKYENILPLEFSTLNNWFILIDPHLWAKWMVKEIPAVGFHGSQAFSLEDMTSENSWDIILSHRLWPLDAPLTGVARRKCLCRGLWIQLATHPSKKCKSQ